MEKETPKELEIEPEPEDMGHLVTTRKVGEGIQIGNVEITILEIKSGRRVRVSIRAPKSYPIDRVD